jgi:hypothetical protein
MWTQSQFADHLKQCSGTDLFYDAIQPKMQEIVILSMKSCVDQIGGR